jgi:predicted transcriptional regulator
MNNVNGFKQMIIDLHNEHNDKINRDIIELHIAKLKDVEINVLNKLQENFKDDLTFNMTAAKLMVHNEVFGGIEDLIEIYK